MRQKTRIPEIAPDQVKTIRMFAMEVLRVQKSGNEEGARHMLEHMNRHLTADVVVELSSAWLATKHVDYVRS